MAKTPKQPKTAKPRKEPTSAKYIRRLARAMALGYTRSQARGHPGKGQKLLSITPPPFATGDAAKTSALAPSGWDIVDHATRTIVDKKHGTFRYTVYELQDTSVWVKSVEKLLKGPFGRHKVYRLIAEIELTAFQLRKFPSSNPRRKEPIEPIEDEIDDDEAVVYLETVGTSWERVPGTSNMTELSFYGGTVIGLFIEFRDSE